jgi:O-antigen ligase
MKSVSSSLFLDTNQQQIKTYLYVLLGLYAALFGYSLVIERWELAAACLLIPAALVLITFPRITLVLFMFCLFFRLQVFFNTSLNLNDIGAVLIIIAALLDFFLKKSLPKSFVRLTGCFLALLVVVFVASLVSTRPELGLSSFVRLLLMMAVFLSVYQLTGTSGFAFAAKLFFGFCALFAVPGILVFLTSGGMTRSFGFTHLPFDDFAMLALPLGLALYLYAEEGKAFRYFIGIALVALGLIATQSRLSIMLGAVHSIALLMYVWWQSRRKQQHSTQNIINTRLRGLLITGFAAVLLFVAIKPELFLNLGERFDVAFGGGRLGDSYVPRSALWSAAFHAFLDHPLLGIGPGNFRSIIELYPELALNYYFFWVRGFSSHNLFLHYLAETGIVGGITVIALFVAALRYSWQSWKRFRFESYAGVSLGLLFVAIIFLVTSFVEAGWMWSQTGLAMAFFMGVIARQRETLDINES